MVPLLSYLAGSAKVITVDIHPWLRRGNTKKAIASLSGLVDSFGERLGSDRGVIRERYGFMSNAAEGAQTLEELLSRLNIEYLCPYDFAKSDLEDKSIDVILSSNVLEHIPPDTLVRIHRETARVLSGGGFAIHRFNPGDHFHDLTGSTVNFLKYEERTWRFLGGYGLSYHNRLRTCEHVDLVRRAGLSLDFWGDSLDSEAMKTLQEGALRIAPRFTGMRVEFLAAFYSWFVLRRQGHARLVEGPLRLRWIDEILDDPEARNFRAPEECAAC